MFKALAISLLLFIAFLLTLVLFKVNNKIEVDPLELKFSVNQGLAIKNPFYAGCLANPIGYNKYKNSDGKIVYKVNIVCRSRDVFSMVSQYDDELPEDQLSESEE